MPSASCKVGGRPAARKAGRVAARIFLLLFLLAVSYIVLFPLLKMISDALKPENDFYDPSVVWLPKALTLRSFALAYEMVSFPISLSSTLLYQMVSAVLEIGVCSIVAYGMARYSFWEKKLLEALLLLTILIPLPMLMIPMTVNYSHLDLLGILGLVGRLTEQELRPNLLNTVFAFWLPSLLGVGLQSGILIYIFRQFFLGLPKELEEAAWVDGAGPIRTYLFIIIPSSGVVFLTAGLFSVIWHWNDTYMPTMFLTERYPLSVAVSMITTQMTQAGMSGEGGLASGVTMAGCLMFIAPMLLLYLILQKWFIKSIDRVGIVG